MVSPHFTCNACRHDSQGSHKVTGLVQWARHLTMNQRHSLFGAWHNEDDTLPLTPPPLRLSRIVPLPCALPHPTQALSPLPAGFSAAAALGCLPASPVMSLSSATYVLLLCSLTFDETYLPGDTMAVIRAQFHNVCVLDKSMSYDSYGRQSNSVVLYTDKLVTVCQCGLRRCVICLWL